MALADVVEELLGDRVAVLAALQRDPAGLRYAAQLLPVEPVERMPFAVTLQVGGDGVFEPVHHGPEPATTRALRVAGVLARVPGAGHVAGQLGQGDEQGTTVLIEVAPGIVVSLGRPGRYRFWADTTCRRNGDPRGLQLHRHQAGVLKHTYVLLKDGGFRRLMLPAGVDQRVDGVGVDLGNLRSVF